MALFPNSLPLKANDLGIVEGEQKLLDGGLVSVVGLVNGSPVGVEHAISLAAGVLRHIDTHARRPLVLLINAGSQLMGRRDELLGLNEYLAHLIKSIYLASTAGSYTVSILYGTAAAGAMVATAMATDTLIAVPGAAPSVMDLPSISRVTKLPLEQLENMSKSTPIFAPGVDPMLNTGAIAEEWQTPGEFATRLQRLLAGGQANVDLRDELGAQRLGRLEAARIARLVKEEALRRA
ncbi:MAG TPA: biotin-independent malonate decarboxylase subunit gamma [Schlesneria sp.]